MSLDDVELFGLPTTPPNPAASARRHRHSWGHYSREVEGVAETWTGCLYCSAVRDEGRARLGRNNRKRGGSHELAAARTYGGRKIGPLGGPVDIEGERYATQVKTHRGLPPRWYTVKPKTVTSLYTVAVYHDSSATYWRAPAPLRWHGIFSVMEGITRRPRLLERFLPGQGIEPRDYLVTLVRDDPAGFAHDALYVAYEGRDWLDLFGADA